MQNCRLVMPWVVYCNIPLRVWVDHAHARRFGSLIKQRRPFVHAFVTALAYHSSSAWTTPATLSWLNLGPPLRTAAWTPSHLSDPALTHTQHPRPAGTRSTTSVCWHLRTWCCWPWQRASHGHGGVAPLLGVAVRCAIGLQTSSRKPIKNKCPNPECANQSYESPTPKHKIQNPLSIEVMRSLLQGPKRKPYYTLETSSRRELKPRPQCQ